MAKILIYARIRPTDHSYEGIQTLKHHVHITMGNEDPQAKFSKTQGPRHQFKFCRVFEQNASQEEVFDAIAKNMIDSFLEGYNGTIFAYGQTSSGKTHTIEGSGRRFADRGLIPRTLSYIYKALEKRGEEEESSVHVSYMEIYQDVGYDLLNAGMRPGALMVTLPKVNVSENPSTGEVTVRHLSSHLAATEEVAQSLLFQGSTCRRVAETAMNQCSSRSHSIFTITLTTKTQGAEVVTKSKLNLVDLAGSERVSKTGVEGRILQEAKHINLSLHHLEHVIVSLQQQARHATITPSNSRIGTREKRGGPPPTRSQSSSLATRQNSFGPQAEGVRRSLSSRSGHGRKERENSGPGVRFGSPRPETKGGRGGEGHIPYRNCMLTMVLRDSLGGNCLTAMIATLSAEEQNLWETISTCRFSQRVACITNTARRNEELDDKAVIRRLKQKITELEKEVIALRTGTITEQQAHKAIEGTNTHSHSLTAPEKQQCHHVLYDFFHGKIDNPVTAGINTGAKFQECLVVLRDIVMHALGIAENEKDTSPKQTQDNPVEELTAEVRTGRTSSSRKEKGYVGDTRHGNPLQEVDYSARVIWKKAWQVESSESKPSTADAGSQSHLVEKSSCEQEKRDKGLSHTINLTPSPNSRLSSGFGSLQEEDAALFESSYNQDIAKRNAAQHPSPPPSVHHNVRAATEVQYTHTTSAQGAGAAPSSLHTSSCQYPMATREQRLSSSQKNAAIDTKSSNQTASGSTVRSPNDGTEKRRSSHSSHTHTERKIKVQSTRHQRNPLFPKSPPFEENQANKSPTSPPFGQCHTSKTLSSTDERALQQLKERQVQLLRSREEQQKLTSDVQLLSLKVQEEELGSRLSEVSEQLARQHAQTLRAQQSEASPEQICAERIAEQQLRIKQAKLHQKLLDVQYQTKMLHLHQGEATTPVKLPTRQENLAATTSLQISTPHVLNELARHEIKQSKVQEQIEKLKVSQIEKQLELKEAATRRKIQALKQQLQGSRNIIQSPPAPTPLGLQPNTMYHSSHVDRLVLEPSHTSANPDNGQTQLHSQQGVMRPSQSQQLSSTVWREKATVNPPATAPGTVQQAHCNKHILVEVPRSEIGHMTGSVNENRHIHDQHLNKTAHAARVQLSFIPEPQVSQSKFTGPQQSVVGSLLKMQRKDAFLSPSSNADCKSTSNSRQLLQVSTTASRRHEHTTPNFEVPPKSSEQHATTKHKFAEQPRHHTKTNSVEQTNMKCINQSKFGTPLKRLQTTEERTPEPFQGNNGLKPRLTLPEEVKETEYMTAVQRQKVRVSRIRRCIIAATVIQRAWREYKQRKC